MLMIWGAVGPGKPVHTFPNSIDSYPIITLTWTRCSFAVVKKRDGLGKVDRRAQCEQRNIHGLQTPTRSGEFPSFSVLYIPIYWLLFILVLSLYSAFIYRLRLSPVVYRRSRSTHLQSHTHDGITIGLWMSWCESFKKLKRKKNISRY